ncbi:hypothetical protein [Nitrosomonas communis]|uniref:Uncharacterized protein n=1 Tax=Nitrosomonas communis TaxID=44574 RepID=A0A1I4P197_9PROT|nr:hypothetical protein [Nitrosomonas communis]SFM21528.1 hypothetical protein SAMN05421863_101761 [Nitrosomonas communis]
MDAFIRTGQGTDYGSRLYEKQLLDSDSATLYDRSDLSCAALRPKVANTCVTQRLLSNALALRYSSLT